MKKLLLISFSILIIGCTTTSGVVPMGNNYFMITRSEKGFSTVGANVKADALKEANTFCFINGKELELIKNNL